ncbi:MAG TPA: hypothetical protein VLS27_16085, partial [Gammaproteobacteria bacterium]|nr:hypothetical protein [Gammaproteobacteria bacterium]
NRHVDTGCNTIVLRGRELDIVGHRALERRPAGKQKSGGFGFPRRIGFSIYRWRQFFASRVIDRTIASEIAPQYSLSSRSFSILSDDPLGRPLPFFSVSIYVESSTVRSLSVLAFGTAVTY